MKIAKYRVLVVEDDPTFAATVRRSLEQSEDARFAVVWKDRGRVALTELDGEGEFDLILVNSQLHDLNGLDLIKAIRGKNVWTPIAILASQKDVQTVSHAFGYSVVDYILKEEASNAHLSKRILQILQRLQTRKAETERARKDLITKRRSDAVKELVVTICHEFNNPLAAMKISTDILLRQKLPQHERDLLQQLDNGIRRIEAEITRLRDLNFEKIDFSNF